MAGKSKYLNFKQNIKVGFSKPQLLDDLQAIAAAPIYVGLPSIFGLSGWAAWAVGVGVPVLIGKATGLYAMARAALALGMTHILYVYGEDMIKAVSKEGKIWELGMNDDLSNYMVYDHGRYTGSALRGLAEDSPNTSYGLQPGSEVRNIGGENLIYYPSIPTNSNSGVNDYITSAMNDYVSNDGINDSYPMNDYVGTEGLVSSAISGGKY